MKLYLLLCRDQVPLPTDILGFNNYKAALTAYKLTAYKWETGTNTINSSPNSPMNPIQLDYDCPNCAHYRNLVTASLNQLCQVYDSSQATTTSLHHTIKIDTHRACGLYTLHEAALLKEGIDSYPVMAAAPGPAAPAPGSGSLTSTPTEISGIPVNSSSLQMAKTAASEYERLTKLPPASLKWTWGPELSKTDIVQLGSNTGRKDEISDSTASLTSEGLYKPPSIPTSKHSLFFDSIGSDVRFIPPTNTCETVIYDYSRSPPLSNPHSGSIADPVASAAADPGADATPTTVTDSVPSSYPKPGSISPTGSSAHDANIDILCDFISDDDDDTTDSIADSVPPEDILLRFHSGTDSDIYESHNGSNEESVEAGSDILRTFASDGDDEESEPENEIENGDNVTADGDKNAGTEAEVNSHIRNHGQAYTELDFPYIDDEWLETNGSSGESDQTC